MMTFEVRQTIRAATPIPVELEFMQIPLSVLDGGLQKKLARIIFTSCPRLTKIDAAALVKVVGGASRG